MKTRKLNTHANTNGHDLAAKAAAAQNIADVARKHFKMLKAEYKQARKAFKQAKKAAKRARKEVEAAAEVLKAKHLVDARHQKPVKKIIRRNHAHTLHRKTHTVTTGTHIPLPSAPVPGISTGTA